MKNDDKKDDKPKQPGTHRDETRDQERGGAGKGSQHSGGEQGQAGRPQESGGQGSDRHPDR
ncbi:hypothetical protein [Frigidibacter sp. SD6-1]|uniref:hypothetical protein n=1 Tax=Frigidibacter sp. SD6-1 TaxID=3032581 RepID=UPI0024E023CC|nr:hypothetical protein [Frigidibacter sp. SD6-1]